MEDCHLLISDLDGTLLGDDEALVVLPHGVNKGSAAVYLASHWSFAADRVLVCGDSGNDLAMFANGFRGIVVGNAHRELKKLNSFNVFQASRHCAGGVLEGLCHWLDGIGSVDFSQHDIRSRVG